MVCLIGSKWVAVFALLAVFAAGCGGGGSSNSNIATVPPAPDFSLSATPTSVNLQAGGPAQTFTVTAAALNGFSGVINVSLSGLPNGLAVTPSTLALTPGISQQISVNAASTEAGGTATVTVEAASGSIDHSAQLTITVLPVPPGFSLSLSPVSISLPAGGAAQPVSITANAVGAFTSPVNVSLVGLPTGVTASPSTLTLMLGSAQSISLQAASTAIPGQASVTIQGASGSLTESAALPLTVAAPAPDFQLFAGPSTLNLSPMGDQVMTVALIPLNGFNNAATVTVSGLPPGVVVINPPLPLIADIPQTIVLGAGGNGNPGSGAAAGQSTVTVTATSGSITHTAQVNLVVSTPAMDFIPELYAGSNPGSATPIPGLLLTPGTYTFSIDASSGGGVTAVQLSGLVPGVGLDQSQYTFTTNSQGIVNPGVFNITVTSSAVGERGVLTAVFTGTQSNHELDLPIYVVPQPTIISYIAPITVQQGAAADLLYEVASTSSDAGAQLYLGPGWPQGFWLNPYLADSNPAITESFFSGTNTGGLISVSADATAATGTINLPFQFDVDNLSQTVPVQTQVVSAADFTIAAEPTTIALNANATQTLTVSASAVDGFSSSISISLDNLPGGLQVSPQTFTLQPGSSQTVTLTTGSGYSSGGALSVDATSGTLAHSTQVAVSPGSFTGDLVVTGNTFSAMGLATIFNSGTFYAVAANGGNATGVVPYVPFQGQINSAASNCGGSTTNSGCTPVNILLLGNEGASFLALPANQPGSLILQANFGGGTQFAIFPYDQVLPDFVLDFSPASLAIPSGGSATLSVTYSAVSPTLTQYCYSPFGVGLGSVGTTLPPGTGGNKATISAPPPIGPILSPNPTVDLCNPQPVTVSVPANTPPGNYELMVAGQISVEEQPYYTPSNIGSGTPYIDPEAVIYAAHTYGIPVTVTAAPAPSFQIGASPTDISVAAGQSFPVTVSATGSNGFTGTISVSASNLPTGITISPASFTLTAGSSQQISISVAAGTATASDQVTLTGTSGSMTSSTQVTVSIP